METLLISALFIKGWLHWKYYSIHEQVSDFMSFVDKIDSIGEVLGWIIKIYGPFFKSHHFDQKSNSRSNRIRMVIQIFLLVWWLVAFYHVYRSLKSTDLFLPSG